MYRPKNSLRLKNFNYKSACIYFITLCVNQHLCLFGEVDNKKLNLNFACKMIAKIFESLSRYYTGIISDAYVVMPDHFHGIIKINRPVRAGLSARPELRKNISLPNKQSYMSKDNFKFFHLNKGNQLYTKKGWVLRPTPTGDQLSLGEIFRDLNHIQQNNIYPV